MKSKDNSLKNKWLDTYAIKCLQSNNVHIIATGICKKIVEELEANLCDTYDVRRVIEQLGVKIDN